MAFYEIPTGVVVSSKIISDAKQSLREIPTSRPYTPRDNTRFTLSKLPVYINNKDKSFSVLSVDYETDFRPCSGQPRITTMLQSPSTSVMPQTSNSKGFSSSSKESLVRNDKSLENTLDTVLEDSQSRMTKISPSEITESKLSLQQSPIVLATTNSVIVSASTNALRTRKDSITSAGFP
ncbi:unnamed protein product [Didymodactylos carnosus]|uniref:Uncharacterized protein n=1 Tax=Didymodactylos carnosus TaxID=1234261 RepID=A0A815EX04_9BILA|nr:unnamed protein product [Didymodactylos carnosus]CAF4161154.1 unnamed protein product [Didymodactylos carnosus]